MSLASPIAGFVAPFVIYAFIFLCHLLLPARVVDGYVVDPVTGRPRRYRLNGLLVLTVTLAAYVALTLPTGIHPDWLYQQRWPVLAGACTLGVLYTAMLVLPAPSGGRPWLVEVFLGRIDNLSYPRHVDVKMFLYLVGAVMLALNTLSFTCHHFDRYGAAANPGVFLHALLLGFFVVDYLLFERVHLYTYDIFAERLGFKLAWGCLAFYPFFYAVGLWATVDRPVPELIRVVGDFWLYAAAALFFTGWIFARGANLQKYGFKRDPGRPFLGFWPQVAVSDGKHSLLCSGFWGLSRHVNYLGEILMALGLAGALGYFTTPWPWLYPLYYLLLLIPRERDDARRCEDKYGPLWDTYRKRVPYRIVPWVY